MSDRQWLYERVKGRDPEPGQACVYVLQDDDGAPFYVGSTTRPLIRRLTGHWQDGTGRDRCKVPVIVAVEHVPLSVQFEAEAALWDVLVRRGYSLVNSRPNPENGQRTGKRGQGALA